ncbi:MAG TPA: hypothetical protein DD827_01645 [Gammaproteobacteria bacterium]|nr:hypothetical protein [Gammaproteobacteria bacterium]
MSNKFANALKKDSSVAEPVAIKASGSPHQRPARKGAKHVGGYFSPEVSRQLRQIALEEDSSVQKLLGEAIDMIFHSRQKPTIAQK